MPLSFKQIVGRLTGISTPIFGVSWNPPTIDRDVAFRVITFLEDRRAIYERPDRAVSGHVIASILEIRRFLTDVIGAGGIAAELSEPLREIRRACRAFLDDPQVSRADQQRLANPGEDDQTLYIGPGGARSLDSLRKTVGEQVALIAVRYGLDVEDELAALLPPSTPA